MKIEERQQLISILESRRRSPRESLLYKILIKDNNLDRIESSLSDNPDIRGVAYDLLEV